MRAGVAAAVVGAGVVAGLTVVEVLPGVRDGLADGVDGLAAAGPLPHSRWPTDLQRPATSCCRPSRPRTQSGGCALPLQLGLGRLVETRRGLQPRLARRARSAWLGAPVGALAAKQLGHDPIGVRGLVLALVLLLPAGAEGLPANDERSSAVMCRFNSATRLFAVPVNDAAGISFNAASAFRRCSFDELWSSAGREAKVSARA